ncbi:YncE family protein [Paenibacillus lactis]
MSVIDTALNLVIATIPVGPNPTDIAITPDGSRAYVTIGGNDTVVIIHIAMNTVIAPTIPVGDGPSGIAITPDGTRAYVTNTLSPFISIINTSSNTVTSLALTNTGYSGIGITPITI